MGEVQIINANEEGYQRQVIYSDWRVATINYSEAFDSYNINRLERHLLTDEVFILLKGKALLYTNEPEDKVIQMIPGIIYNVKAGTWHAISVNKDTKVLIIESDSTSVLNTEYKSFK